MKRLAIMVLSLSGLFTGSVLARPVHGGTGGAIGLVEVKLREMMKEPGSTQFRDVKVEATCVGQTYVTGWANAKNSYGAYGGFKIFVARVEHEQATIMQAGGESLVPDAEVRAHIACTDPGYAPPPT